MKSTITHSFTKQLEQRMCCRKGADERETITHRKEARHTRTLAQDSGSVLLEDPGR